MKDDTVSRAAAIDAVSRGCQEFRGIFAECEKNLNTLPAIQTCEDAVSRQQAIDAMCELMHHWFGGDPKDEVREIKRELEKLPSAQPTVHPQRTCVNCGRTVNNGGWYADGRTRCPIEEHYALPKDGYCHLWEKRKDWEDDYVKRAEEGEK